MDDERSPSSADIRSEHTAVELQHATDRIAADFAGAVDRGTVERILLDAVRSLADSKVQSYVPLLAERLTRERLKPAKPGHETSEQARPSVLFLCTHNAGRSQIATGWLRHLAGDRAAVYSGGSEPASHLNPAVVEAMAEVAIDIAKESPKRWREEEIRTADIVVTMGCGDACPVYSGVRYLDWEVEDPQGAVARSHSESVTISNSVYARSS